MARSRTELHVILAAIPGVVAAYFHPPSNIRMQYPAIVYEWTGRHRKHADNNIHMDMKEYQVTVIDRDPDSKIPDMVGALPYCSMNTTFVSEDLYHTIHTIYF